MNWKEKRLFLLDLDGTIYLEEELLPGAAAFLAWVRANGGQYRFLTNNSSRGVDAGLEKMHRLGIPAERKDFLTAVEATIHYLRTRRSPDDVYYAVGTESFRRQLREAGFDLRDGPDDDVTAVLTAFDTELTYQKVENACRLLARGADFLATNPDLACPTLFGFIPDCGAICQFIVRVDTGIQHCIYILVGGIMCGMHSAVLFINVSNLKSIWFFLPRGDQFGSPICRTIVDNQPYKILTILT